MNDFKPANFKQYLIIIVLISVIAGGLAGGTAGFISGSLFSGSFNQWLTNPFGVSNIIKLPADQNANQGANQPSLSATDEESSTTQAVAKVTPVVVSIIVTKELQQYYNVTGPDSPFDNFFNFPFDQFFNAQQPLPGPKTKQEVGGGTGFIISPDGLIATNRHVVADTDAEYSVIMNDGSRFDASVVARDPFNDVAFLKISQDNLPVVTLGDSDKLKAGQTVIAIGFSLGEYSNSVTKGIISGIGRDIVASGGGQGEKLEGVIQTDAAINPGNSGGPLINLSGQVIGINTAINQGGQLVGFAIPINNVKTVIQSVKEKGRIIRPYLGVRYVQITKQLAEQNNLKYNYGVLVIRGESQGELAVQPGSPADRAGLVENDIILEINGVKLDSGHSLAEEIAKRQPNDVVTLKVAHDGAEKTVSAELAEYPSQ